MHQRQRFSKKILIFFAVASCLTSTVYPPPKKSSWFFLLDGGRNFVYFTSSFLVEYFIKSSLGKLIQEFACGVRVLELLIVHRERLQKKLQKFI